MKQEYTEEEVEWAKRMFCIPPEEPREVLIEDRVLWEKSFYDDEDLLLPSDLGGKFRFIVTGDASIVVECYSQKRIPNTRYEEEMAEYQKQLAKYNKIRDIRTWNANRIEEQGERKLLAELKQKYESNN
jgi:hypothetical protein